MNEFMMIFRSETTPEAKLSPEQLQEIFSQWQHFIGGIAAQGKLVSKGNRLGTEGKTLKPNNVVTDGPYVEIKEMLSGYIVIKAASIDEALTLAKECPILSIGGNVEVRNIMPSIM